MEIRKQFGHPTGWMGALIGHLMALKNRERSEWILAQLALAQTDRVLEIGFGPGVDVKRAAARATSVAGIDRSDVMLRQATRRNRAGVDGGRIELRLGTVPPIPFGDGAFDKAFSINSFQFWKDEGLALAELRRVMKPGGIVALAVQPRNKGATEATAREVGRQMAAALTAAGFSDVAIAFHAMRPVSTACVTARAYAADLHGSVSLSILESRDK
jgi:ubiquinone/menaquinone biosynthesis C-methylase UbiE